MFDGVGYWLSNATFWAVGTFIVLVYLGIRHELFLRDVRKRLAQAESVIRIFHESGILDDSISQLRRKRFVQNQVDMFNSQSQPPQS